MELAEARSESKEPGPRKHWVAEPSDSVLQMLANASLMSSDSMTSPGQAIADSTHGSTLSAEAE